MTSVLVSGCSIQRQKIDDFLSEDLFSQVNQLPPKEGIKHLTDLLSQYKPSESSEEKGIQRKFRYINYYLLLISCFYKFEPFNRKDMLKSMERYQIDYNIQRKLKAVVNAAFDKIVPSLWDNLCPWEWSKWSSAQDLEGSNTFVAGRFFLSVLKKMIPNETIEVLKKNLTFYIQLSIILDAGKNQLSQTPEDFLKEELKEFIFSHLMTMLQFRLKDLSIGEDCFIPIGSNNHAVLLRLMKEEEEVFTIEIFNTGSGHSYHKGHIEKDFFEKEPLTYRITGMPSENFWKDLLFVKLFASDPKKLYEVISRYYPKELQISSGKRYALQSRGSCSFSCIRACLSTTMKPEMFKELREKAFDKIDGYFTRFKTISDPLAFSPKWKQTIQHLGQIFYTNLEHAFA